MSRAEVLARSSPEAAPQQLKIRINGPNPTFLLKTEDIETRLLEPIDDLLLDLLDVAGAIFSVDGTVPRGGDTRPRFGERWQRQFDVRMEVRRPDVWRRGEVTDALQEAIDFLTGDRFRFSFEPSRTQRPAQDYLKFSETDAPAFHIDEVILFSGGLDSLTGAIEALKAHGGRVALVTHRSAPKVNAMQTKLAAMLREKRPGRVLHIPVQANRVGGNSSDRTQRSRSFLFAVLGHVAARLLGARAISFYENGTISHNLPINRQVIGTMATRTTHPRSLLLLDRFLATLDTPRIAIVDPYAWLTKTEVLERLAKNGGAPLIRHAISCTNVTSRSNEHPHCGACSQCLDRRFAVLAAGLEDYEPPDGYATDVLYGARETDKSRTMAMDWTRHAIALAEMRFADFAQDYMSELMRIAKGHPGLSPMEVVRRTQDLQTRHGKAVKAVMMRALSDNAGSILARELPETSLLRMYVHDVTRAGKLPLLAPTRDRLADPSPREARMGDPLLPLQIEFLARGAERRVRIIGLTEIAGPEGKLAHALRPTFEEDRERKVAREQARYVRAKELASALNVTDGAIRKYASRCRAELAEAYEQLEGAPPDRDLLIETRKPRGYRIDPDCRPVGTDHEK